MFFDELNEDNFLLFAIKNYENPQAVTKDDLINHFIVLYNIFGDAATPMLFYKIEQELWSVMKTFIVFLNRLPDTPRCYIHDIHIDINCLGQLRKTYYNPDGKD